MNSVRSFEQNESQNANVYNLLAKLDRILRIYRCAKKPGFSMLEEVRARVETLLCEIQAAIPDKYKQIQGNLSKLINDSLAEPKPEPKPQIKSGSSRNSQINVQSSSLSQSYHDKSESKRLKRSGASIGIQASFNSIRSSKQQNIKNESQIRFEKKQDSKQLSISSSTGQNAKDLRSYCQINMNILQNKIQINQDVLNHIKSQPKDRVTLLGVQKPQNMEKQKLFICTIMQFEKDEVLFLNYKQEPFSAQLEEFQNVIRCPLALCVIGSGINDIRAHYAKFLLQMTSPVPIIIILNPQNIESSVFVKIKGKCIDNLSRAKNLQIQKIDKNFAKNKDLYKVIPFAEIPINKQKCVTTKNLERKVRKKVYQNKLAIMIENPKGGNQSKNKMGIGLGGGGMPNVMGSGIGISGGMGMGSGNMGSGMKMNGNQNSSGIGISKGAFSISGNNSKQEKEKGFGNNSVEMKVQQPPAVTFAASNIVTPPAKVQTPNQVKIEQAPKQKQVCEKKEKKEEQHSQNNSVQSKIFNFKLHAKYLTAQIKQTNYVYLINQQNQFCKRKGFKTLKEATAFVHNNSGQRYCIQIISKKDGVVFDSQILLELYDRRAEVEIFSIKFKKLTLTKVYFFRFKQEINRADVQQAMIDLKSFDNDTKLTNCIIVINQTNIGSYQTKNPYQQI